MPASSSCPFVKLSACGNDFILVRRADLGPRDPAAVARHACRRRLALGADGLLVVSPAAEGWSVVHLEPDGMQTFCLNGLRATATWAAARAGWTQGDLILHTELGPLPVRPGDPPWVPLPPPRSDAPLEVPLGAETVPARWLDVGNPQLIVPRTPAELEAPELMTHGATLRNDLARFPAGTNVTFTAPDPAGLRVRTYERGVEGETLACGTGVVAAACAHHTAGGWDGDATLGVRTQGGEVQQVRLERDADGALTRVWSAAAAELVAWGELRLP